MSPVKDFLLSKLEHHPCFHRPKDISNPLLDSDLNEISLKNSEIHIGSQRGINCSLNSLSVESWPLGTVVLKSLIKVNIKK